jgi:hypothetical protein
MPSSLSKFIAALWVLLGDVAGDARSTLAEVGGLLTASLEQHDVAAARRALAAARFWLESTSGTLPPGSDGRSATPPE